MPGLLDDCLKYFETKDLYVVLGINQNANDSEVKKGYRRLSLKVHPDRVSPDEKDEATEKFQTLGKVYSILSDKEKRAVYDETGEVDDENDIPRDRNWDEYWRLLFHVVTVEDVKNFEKNYKDSEEELNDLKEAYMKYEGDMDQIMDAVLCATVVEDEQRFTSILNKLIKSQEIPDFSKFSKETAKKNEKRKKKAVKEAQEAEDLKNELGIGTAGSGDDSLKALIKQRQQSREQEMDGFFSHLEQKYASKKSTKRQASSAGKTTKNSSKKDKK